MLRRSAVLIAVIGSVAAFGLAGCGSSSSSSSNGSAGSGTTTSSSEIHLPTAKFVLHFGLAGGAFHRYIYKPFKAGKFSHPLSHKLTLIKAALAALFIYHELKLAAADARASKILAPVVAPLTAAADKVKGLRAQLLGGSPNPADISALQATGGQVGGAAAAKGIQAPDIVPSASQLAGG